MFKILDGKKIAEQLRCELTEKIFEFKKIKGKKIVLAVILVGQNHASQIYVRNKIKACEEVGITSLVHRLPEQVSQQERENLIKTLADDKSINGILVQLPLPAHLSQSALKLIPDSKDVDGFSENNVGKLCLNLPTTVACTPYGVMKMLEYEHIEIKGKNAVVVGRSNIVGKPMAMLLLNADATVTVCHSKTKNLKEQCLKADILVAAIGQAKYGQRRSNRNRCRNEQG